ncbi:MAG: polymerase sigma-54 factor RpoN [Candidatus Angelobacter sp.]|jgi:RNA polymerase sigma-70 factor (ECF subfamily)|nr:polymerase sigma-54 factor RpoN [Candidatus Angelobacter sp.]
MDGTIVSDHSSEPRENLLLRRAKAGDSEAYTTIMESQRKRMLRLAWRVTKNHEDAEDAVQNAFVKVLMHLHAFQERSRFSTWVLRITLNECLSQARQKHGHPWISLDQDTSSEQGHVPEIQDTRQDPEQCLGNQQLRSILSRAISLLKPTLRSVLVMRDIKQLSIKETALALNLKDSTVKIRLMRARLSVRNQIFRLTKPSKLAASGLDPIQASHLPKKRATFRPIVRVEPGELMGDSIMESRGSADWAMLDTNQPHKAKTFFLVHG